MLGARFSRFRQTDEGKKLRDLITQGRTDEGHDDAGFLTLAYGLNLFWLCMVVAPVTCYGTWAWVPFLSGACSFGEALSLLLERFYRRHDNSAWRHTLE